MATVEELLALPYHIELVARGDSRWQARVLELEGCVAERGSPAEAADAIRDEMAAWFAAAFEQEQPVPAPIEDRERSGFATVRLPGGGGGGSTPSSRRKLSARA